MKRYLIGLALTGLTTRLAKRASSILPRRRHSSLPVQAAGALVAAGIGAALMRMFSSPPRRPYRK